MSSTKITIYESRMYVSTSTGIDIFSFTVCCKISISIFVNKTLLAPYLVLFDQLVNIFSFTVCCKISISIFVNKTLLAPYLVLFDQLVNNLFRSATYKEHDILLNTVFNSCEF